MTISIEQYIEWQGRQPTMTGSTNAVMWAQQGITTPMQNETLRSQAQQAIELNERRAEMWAHAPGQHKAPWQGQIDETIKVVVPVLTSTPTTTSTAAPVVYPLPAFKSSNKATDGYDGAYQFLRDTRGQTGGKPGNVNCANFTYTIAGKDVKAFEWNVLALLDNYAAEGENVALYAQANKHDSGPTWGACIEATDTTPGDATGLVGLEVDCWVTGPDNGQRIGVDVVVGDSRLSRGLGASAESIGSVGVRVGSSNVAPHAKWTTGIEFLGNMDVGIDLTKCNTKEGIKLKAGQSLTIGGTDIKSAIYISLSLSILSLITTIVLKYV